MNTNWFNIIGLILDIVGVLLLFKYGLPSKIEDAEGGFVLTSEGKPKEIRERIIKKNKRIYFWSHFGLFLLIIGFILQVISAVFNIFP
jgi:hypothetical protein